jgi:hypothetical protein
MDESQVSQAYEALMKFLEDNGGEYLELTPKKIRERGKVFHDPERPNVLLLDVERHRSLPGSWYEKGHPIPAFETYTQRIAFDPEARQLDILDEVVVGRTINIQAMAAQQLFLTYPMVFLKRGCKNKHVIRMSVDSSFRLETSSLSKAAEAVQDFVQSLDFKTSLEGIGQTPEEDARYAQELSDAFAVLAGDRVKRDWDKAEEEE